MRKCGALRQLRGKRARGGTQFQPVVRNRNIVTILHILTPLPSHLSDSWYKHVEILTQDHRHRAERVEGVTPQLILGPVQDLKCEMWWVGKVWMHI